MFQMEQNMFVNKLRVKRNIKYSRTKIEKSKRRFYEANMNMKQNELLCCLEGKQYHNNSHLHDFFKFKISRAFLQVHEKHGKV